MHVSRAREQGAAANAAGPASGRARIPAAVAAPSPATSVRCCSTAPRGAATSTRVLLESATPTGRMRLPGPIAKRLCSSSCLAAIASCGTGRVGAEEAASLNAPTRGIPPDRAKTKAAGVGPGCCEGPPVEVSILFMCSGANTVARRQDPQNRRKPPKIEVDRPKLSPPANFKPP